MESLLQAHSLDVEAASVCESEERVPEVRDDHRRGIERLELGLDGVEDRHELGLAGKAQSDDRALDALHRTPRLCVEPGRDGLPHAPRVPPSTAREPADDRIAPAPGGAARGRRGPPPGRGTPTG